MRELPESQWGADERISAPLCHTELQLKSLEKFLIMKWCQKSGMEDGNGIERKDNGFPVQQGQRAKDPPERNL